MSDYWDFSDVDVTPYVHNEQLVNQLMAIAGPERKKSKEREFASRALMALSEKHPDSLSHQWDECLRLFQTSNASSKMVALYVIANVAMVDQGDRFEAALPDYVRLLNDDSVGVCSHAAMNLGKIAKSNPALRQAITRSLLNIRDINRNPERVDLIAGYAVKAFDQFFDLSDQQGDILCFVHSLLDSGSPSTRKLAKDFLKARGIH